MQHERWSVRQRADAVDGFLERAGNVHIGDVFEADMAVADLHEAEVTLGGAAGLSQVAGRQDAGAQCPHDAGASPRHALEESAPVDLVSMVEFVEDSVSAHWT